MRRLTKVVLLGFALVVIAIGLVQVQTEAAKRLPVDCSIVLCPAPDCPPGTKPVILPGDCCFSCLPAKGK